MVKRGDGVDYDALKRARTFLSILLNISFIILLGVLLFLIYQVYATLTAEPESLNIELQGQDSINPENGVSEVKQFYPNMKFNHNRISYKINLDCSQDKKDNMIAAFNELSKNVNNLEFYPSFDNYDIEIICDKENQVDIDEKHFVAGEGGAKEIIQTGKYNIINQGLILLYESSDIKTLNCNYPSVELHELLHVFGFEHSENKNSIMYPYLDSCRQVLDDSITILLDKLYSKENLPDLYFENVSAVLNKCGLGSCLDFNLTIRNSGSINAENVSFSVLDDGKLVQTRKVGAGFLEYGSGIFIEVKNFKLLHRNPSEVMFVLDYDGIIQELDEDNNIAKASFDR